MASISATSTVCLKSSARSVSGSDQATWAPFRIRSVSLARQRESFFLRQAPVLRFQISCKAKPETVEKVCTVVKKQLAIPDGTPVTAESAFDVLGADSLDTVELMIGLEEEFGISMDEDKTENIETIQDVADLIENIMAKN
ncbi:acyl carrier protein 2, chloroplastic-like [Wolffia australiana]